MSCKHEWTVTFSDGMGDNSQEFFERRCRRCHVIQAVWVTMGKADSMVEYRLCSACGGKGRTTHQVPVSR